MNLGLRTNINGDDAADGNWQVQVIYDQAPDRAIEKSLAVLPEIDTLVTMLGERTGWLAGLPIYPLAPINFNCRANTAWALERGYVPEIEATRELAETLGPELKAGRPQLLARLDRAQKMPVNGAENIAQIIAQRVREKAIA